MQHAFGVSSNGRTRDFGSLYHGSNPCAPTNIQTPLVGVLILVLGLTEAEPHGSTMSWCLTRNVRETPYECPAGKAQGIKAPQPNKNSPPGAFFI